MQNVMNRFKMRSTIVVMVAIFGLFGAILMAPNTADAKINKYNVESYDNTAYTSVENNFNQGDTVYAKGTRSSKATLRMQFVEPDGDIAHTTTSAYTKTLKKPYSLPSNAEIGTWKIELQKRYWKWGWKWVTKETDTFNVTPAPFCGDGIVNGEEECDPQTEPNYPPGFYCTDECTVAQRPTAEVFASKIVCDNEEDLPNWGNVHGDQFIDENTARDYVTKSEDKCHFARWNFQYKTGDATNPGDNTGEASSWTTFQSSAMVDILDSNLIKIREVMDDKYIPFTGANHAEDISAEIYCANDNFNYDNFDYITNAQNGEVYYCVAWNVKKTAPVTFEKIVDQGNPDDWTFTYNDHTYQNGETVQLPIGGGIVTENGPDYYSFVNASGICSEDGNVYINITEEGGTCTFTNRQDTFDIHGYKWNDLNGNSKYDCDEPLKKEMGINSTSVMPFPDECEPKLSGWTIFIDQNENSLFDNEEQSTVTDEGGNYEFTGLTAGTYTVCEVQQAGWLQTFPAEPNCYQITLPTLQPDSPSLSSKNFIPRPLYNFGNFKLASLKGKKCDDPNGNGNFLEGHGENDCIPLANWEIELYKNLDDSEPMATATTNSNGIYLFKNLLEPGQYYVREVMQEGWTQTRPQIPFGRDYHVVNVKKSGKTYWRNFGNYLAQCGNNILDTGEECDGQGDGIATGMYCSETCTLEPYYTLSKTDNKDTAQPGDNSTYEITFGYTQEEHPLIMGGLIVDTLPDNFSVDETTISDNGTYDNTAKTISWDLDEVEGAAHTFTFSGTISEDMPDGTTILTNTAKLYQKMFSDTMVKTYGEMPKPLLLLTATDETSVTSFDGPFLTIAKDVDATEAGPGDTLNYTIVVTNVGDQPATDVVVDDVLPAGLTYQDGTTTKQWLYDVIASGASETIKYIAIIDPEAVTDDYTNIATVEAVGLAAVKDDATTAIVEEVKIPIVLGEESLPSLTVDKSVDRDFANPGDTVTYTVVVTNNSDAMAVDTVLIDHIAAGMQFTDTVAPTHTWMLGDIAPGNSVTTTYDVVILKDNEPGIYTNTAEVWAQGVDNIFDKADLEVRKIQVLGAETLPTTGGSVMPFIYLLGAGLVITFSGFLLKLTVAKK